MNTHVGTNYFFGDDDRVCISFGVGVGFGDGSPDSVVVAVGNPDSPKAILALPLEGAEILVSELVSALTAVREGNISDYLGPRN